MVAGLRAARYGRSLIAVGLLLMLVGFLGSALAVGLVPHHGTGWATLGIVVIAAITAAALLLALFDRHRAAASAT